MSEKTFTINAGTAQDWLGKQSAVQCIRDLVRFLCQPKFGSSSINIHFEVTTVGMKHWIYLRGEDDRELGNVERIIYNWTLRSCLPFVFVLMDDAKVEPLKLYATLKAFDEVHSKVPDNYKLVFRIISVSRKDS